MELTPRHGTIADVRGHPDPTERALAAVLYLRRLHEMEGQAFEVRDEAIRAAPETAPELARILGVSVATVKHARRGPTPPPEPVVF